MMSCERYVLHDVPLTTLLSMRSSAVQTEDDIVRHQPAGGNLRSSDIIVNNLRISYAMQNRNPVDLIHFFDDW